MKLLESLHMVKIRINSIINSIKTVGSVNAYLFLIIHLGHLSFSVYMIVL